MPRSTYPAAWKYVRPLDQIDAGVAALAGGKAAALARLSKERFPVVPGFCVLASAHARARAEGRLPEDVRREVAQAYQHLFGEQPAALIVRSSALAEDGAQASYAGQYQSIADVCGLEALFGALQYCWRSAGESPAAAYAAARDAPPQPEMAVLVQRMLRADLSGVAFTMNPRTNNPRQMVIELTQHSPAAVEQGAVMPTRVVLEKSTGRIIPVLSSGPIPPGAPLQRLARAARQIERRFGAPQDIEWAVEAGKLWILQSRPVTGIAPAREVWTRANAGEILPGAVTPLTWSVFRPVLERAGWHAGRGPLVLHWRWRHPAQRWAQSPALFDGRAYMELSSVYASFAGYPGVDAGLLQKALGFEFSLLAADEFPERLPRWHPVDPYRWARYGLEMRGITRTLEATRRRLERGSARLLAAKGELAGFEGLRRADRLEQQAARVLGAHITCTAYAFSAYGRLLQRLPADLREWLASKVVTGAQEMTTARHMRAIWELAAAVRDCPPAAAALREADHLTAVPGLWRECPAAQAVTRRWEEFLRVFGSRSTQEFELSVPRWEEDPGVILAAVAAELTQAQPDPAIGVAERQAAVQQEIDRVGSAAQRLYRAYARFSALRENLKHDLVRIFAALRETYLRLGADLARSGALEAAADIFFLEKGQISAAVSSSPPQNLRSTTAERKAAYKHWQERPAISVFARRGEQIYALELENSTGPGVFHGTGCSGGVARGPAAVLRQVDGSQSIAGGHILVAPSIDPGLTPLLLNAAGLVTEVGGVLSHGATLAREFGLPAVCGIAGVTAQVQDGQEISVDGFTGVVRIYPLEEGAE